jgi:hypothetical protein
MEQRADALDAREQSLQMELDRLRDPQRVAVAARSMGMVPPGAPAFLRLEDGKVLGSPAPAVAEDAVRVIPLPTRKPKSLRPDPVILELPKKSRGEHGAAARERGGSEGTNASSNRSQQGSSR